jgi:hypothetical protein
VPLLVKAQYGNILGAHFFRDILITLDVLAKPMHQHDPRAGLLGWFANQTPKLFTT